MIADLLGEPVPSPRPQASCGWARTSSFRRPSGPGAPPAVQAHRRRPGGSGAGGDRWEGRLRSCSKVLAAEEPLSLPRHPNLEQARELGRRTPPGSPSTHRTATTATPTTSRSCSALTDRRARRISRRPNPPHPSRCSARWTCRSPSAARQPARQPARRTNLRALFTTWITLLIPMLDSLVNPGGSSPPAGGRPRCVGGARRRWSSTSPSATRTTPACSPRCCFQPDHP
ncbi:hypothetical protein HBB16_01725 [Pseudonocardia sp. MCCB 268]|nr:hypothetical protein [Pseudonocardia cytotoxica]